MKKLICLLMIFVIILVPTIALADTGEAIQQGTVIVTEMVVNIAATLLLTLLAGFGAWLTATLDKKTKLANINAAQQEVIQAAKVTVGELQQTIVDDLKAAHVDGKLTKDEITNLGKKLMTMTTDKISAPSYNLLKAAAVDVEALITGAGESWINRIKKE
ncbi:MAG: hypothetical protein RR475_11730 [Clostridia bacterium]